jgi:hypothetical protein
MLPTKRWQSWQNGFVLPRHDWQATFPLGSQLLKAQSWGQGEPLLLVPGLAGGLPLMAPLVRQLSQDFQVIFGKNRVAEYSGAFFSGAVGSLLGHPADTMLSCWQNGMKAKVSYWMRGGATRTLSGGILTIIYTFANNLLQGK